MHKASFFIVIFINIILLISIFSLADCSSSSLPLTILSNKNESANSTSKTDLASVGSTNEINMTTGQIQLAVGLSGLINQGYDGTGVIIGLVDTGVYNFISNTTFASEFGSRVIATKSFVSTANNYAGNDSTITDSFGHGTEVASLLIGNTYGMAKGAKLVAAKIYSNGIAGNAGYQGEETTRGVYNGILYCVQHGASVINLSFGQYSNIVNDGRQYIVDQMSKKYNVIFTISAGNDGLSGVDGASIGTPGTSFQAITVAASNGRYNMASFSSSGIRSDYTMKPDVSAPGVGVNTILGLESGTSESAPIVAGGIAVLIQALAKNGRSYTVGAIKAALIKTADPIPNYPIWYQGAGMVNFTAAFNLLMSEPKSSNNVPIIATAFPTQLPVIPLNNLFIDQTVPFNLTVISSIYNSATISLHGIPTDTMSFNKIQYFNASDRLSLLFHPTSTTKPGLYKGFLLLDFSLGPTVNVSIEFTVKIPVIKVLFDETKNGFINEKKPHGQYQLATTHDPALQDPWGFSTFLLGQYREFYNIMALNNISITPFYTGQYTNLTYLQNFDEIIFSYPNSMVTNPFTDWYNDPLFGNLFKLTEPTLLFTSTELSTLNAYVKEDSKSILIMTSDQRFTNTTAFNSILSSFNIGYNLTSGAIYDNEPLQINSSNAIFNSVSSLDYYGTSFTSLNTNNNTIALENNKFLLLNNLSRTTPDSGRIIVSGSAYFAENYMLNPYSNGNYRNDCKFLLNLLTWLKGNESLISQITSYSPTYYPTFNNNPTTYIISSSSSSSTSSMQNLFSFSLIATVLIVSAIVIIKRKHKKI